MLLLFVLLLLLLLFLLLWLFFWCDTTQEQYIDPASSNAEAVVPSVGRSRETHTTRNMQWMKNNKRRQQQSCRKMNDT